MRFGSPQSANTSYGYWLRTMTMPWTLPHDTLRSAFVNSHSKRGHDLIARFRTLIHKQPNTVIIDVGESL